MKTFVHATALSLLLLSTGSALADQAKEPEPAAPAQAAPKLEPITLSPDEVAAVVTMLGQQPAAQSGQLYNFFVAKEQAAQAAKAKK